jgi:hypothetical protein
MIYAFVENQIVANTVFSEHPIDDPSYVEIGSKNQNKDPISIGWQYIDGQFLPPPRDIEAEWEVVRTQRDQLLTESDIYVLPDRWNVMTPEEQTAWSEYRQALRDIPQVYDDPADVVWPTKPTT